MKRIVALALALVGLALGSSGAWAQCQRIIQNGTVQNNAPVVWVAPCLLGQAGPSTGSPGNPPMLNDLGVQGNLGVIDAPNTGAFHSALLGWSSSVLGEFDINLTNVGPGGVSAALIENGIKFPLPGPGTGNVVGPTNPLPVAGDAVVWNGGLTVKDPGFAPALKPTIPPNLGDVACWASATLSDCGAPIQNSFAEWDILSGTGVGTFQARYADTGVSILDSGDPNVCTGPSHDDTAAFIKAAATGASINIPVNAACNLATFGYGAPVTSTVGNSYNPGDSISLNNGATVTLTSVTLVSVAKTGSGTGYSAGDYISLVGGTFSGSGQATVLVNTVDGSGEITGYSLVIGGFYTTTTSTFTSSGGHGSGATWGTAVWGAGHTAYTPYAVTSHPSTASQTGTSGSGTGAVFSFNYYAVPLTANGQCVRGSGRATSSISSSSTTAYGGFFMTFGQNECIENLTLTAPHLTDGWLIDIAGTNGNFIENINFVTVPGAVAISNPASTETLRNIRTAAPPDGSSYGTVGGSLNLVDPTATGKGLFLCHGDSSAGNAGPVIGYNIIAGTGQTLGTSAVNGLVLDGNCNSSAWYTVRMNLMGRGLWMTDTPNVSLGTAAFHPAFAAFFDYEDQTPANTTAGTQVDSGDVISFYNTFTNHAYGSCFRFGLNTEDVNFFGPRINGCALSGIDFYGSMLGVTGGVVESANNYIATGTSSCAACGNITIEAGATASIQGILAMGNTGTANSSYDIQANGAGNVVQSNNNFSLPLNDPNSMIASWPPLSHTFTPTPTFATPGNQSFNCAAAQIGYWWNSGTRIDYYFRLTCTPTFTTASGAFSVTLTGLPAGLGGTAGATSAVVSRWDNFTLDSGYTHVGAETAGGAASVNIFENGSGKVSQALVAANLTTGSVIKLDVSGWYPANQ